MEGAAYAPPRVRDYGDLVDLTKADATMLHVGIGAGANTSSTSLTPGGGGGGGGGIQGKTTPGGSLGDTLPAFGNGGASPTDTAAPGGTLGASGGGGSGGGGSGGSGGGSLPFTGFSVAVVGALGSGLTAAGAALRRGLSRGQSPD